MRDTTRTLRRGACAALFTAALGFGGAQAFAAPAAPTQDQPTCSQVCNALCRSIGAFGGFCPDAVSCVCYIR